MRSACDNHGEFYRGTAITVYVGREETIFATVQDNGNWVATPAKFLELKLPWIGVLPQIGPLLTEEYRLTDDRVAAYLNSRLSSRHYRNELVRMETALLLKQLAEETWHGLMWIPFNNRRQRTECSCLCPSGTAISWQKLGGWVTDSKCGLQTIWFLSRTPPDCTVSLMSRMSTCPDCNEGCSG